VPRTEVEARLRARVPTIQAVTTFGRRQGVKA
jgi:hypothetical protein